MTSYRARDLASVPGLLSLSRLPLAAAFSLSWAYPAAALAILLAAGISDVLDGWYARRFGQVTATGTALDPVTDKIFVSCVALTLVVRHALSPVDVILLSTREIGELPLVVWIAMSPRARSHRAAQPSATFAGKLATVLQFAAVTAAIVHFAHLRVLVELTGLAGIVAATNYWARALREARAFARDGVT